jgi:hypothetical protein
MNIKDSKRNVFTTIGAYTSYIQNTNNKSPKSIDTFTSINNKNDIVPFLLDILKSLVGSVGLKDLIGNLFTEFINNVEPQLKNLLKKQMIQYNSSDPLPNNFKSTGSGIIIPLKKIDIYGKLKTSPNSEVGKLLYNNSKPNFDSIVYNAIKNGSTETYLGFLEVRYDSSTDGVILKSSSTASSKTIGNWYNDYIDDTSIIHKKEFMTNVMNSIYGTTTNIQKKSIDEVFKELQVDKTLENLIDNDDDSFDLSQKDIDDLLQKSKEMVEGVVYYDMGCGLISASLPMSGMTNVINQISNSNDPYAVGNAVDATVDQSTASDAVAKENKQTIKDGFFQRLIKIITLMLTKIMTTSIEIKTLMIINSILQGGDGSGDFKNNKAVIKCLVKEAMKLIIEYIFKIVVTLMVAFLVPIVKKIIIEKINQYIGVIKSLIA